MSVLTAAFARTSVQLMHEMVASDELVARVIEALTRWCAGNSVTLKYPVSPETQIERDFRTCGDDIWEMLEWLRADLGVIVYKMDGPRFFHQESQGYELLNIRRKIVPLTPRIIANHLRVVADIPPPPELLGQVILLLEHWRSKSGNTDQHPIQADTPIMQGFRTRGDSTEDMLVWISDELDMVFAEDFDHRRYLKEKGSLTELLHPFRKLEPITPQIIADNLRAVRMP